MKALLSVGVAVTALLAAASAFAADLPYRKAPPAYFAPPPPVFTWTGFYVGVNGGGSFGDFTNGGKTLFGSASGGMVGGTIGYNLQYSQYVFGIEADLDWADVNGSKTFANPLTTKSTVDAFGTIRARAGYSIDRALLFVTGGYAGADVSAKVSNGIVSLSDSQYMNGWVIGAGVEYAFTNNISAKAEYLYSQLGPNNYFNNAISSGVNLNTVRVGLNYHF